MGGSHSITSRQNSDGSLRRQGTENSTAAVPLTPGGEEGALVPRSLEEQKGSAITICVGDLHGNLAKLEKLWQNLEKKIGTGAFRFCHVVFLGDYCDRGPDTKGVLDFLTSLRKLYPDQSHAFIAGNHDIGMSAFLGTLPPGPEGFRLGATWKEHLELAPKEQLREGWWEGEGMEDMHLQGRRWGGRIPGGVNSTFDSASTFTSYGCKLGDREALLASVPEHHKDFLTSLEWVHEAPGPVSGEYGSLIAVHAGLEKDRPVGTQLELLRARDVTLRRLEALSGRTGVWEVPPELKKKNVVLVSGHHGTLKVDQKHRLIVDESGGRHFLPLAAVVLPKRIVVRDCDN